jgi:hypothetical protein
MAIEVESKDCTAVTDAELDEMAQLSSESPNSFSMGLLSKQTEEWVLVAEARENGKLRGYGFFTLERIGGTPCVVLGVGAVVRSTRRSTVLRALLNEVKFRALMAFPDEDVLIGVRLNDAGGYEAFSGLDGVVPRRNHKPSGEERAWGRRLAKRFEIGAERYDDRAFVAAGDGSQPSVFDHETVKPTDLILGVAELFAGLKDGRGDHVIAFGWARADDLEKLR